jgi:hypothetical protein
MIGILDFEKRQGAVALTPLIFGFTIRRPETIVAPLEKMVVNFIRS